MPVMNGFEATKRILAYQNKKNAEKNQIDSSNH